jgi:hypothetical protein
MRDRFWVIGIVWALLILLGAAVVYNHFVDSKSSVKPAALMTRLLHTSNGIDIYRLKRGYFPPNLESLREDSFDLFDSVDPYGDDRMLFGYATISTATGERCELYTNSLSVPAKIGWVVADSTACQWHFTKELRDFMDTQRE